MAIQNILASLDSVGWFELAKFAVSTLTLVSIVIAYRGYKTNVQKLSEDKVRDRDKELLAQTQKSLEWAYAVLTDDGKTIPPKPDRLNWLTAARHLLRAKKLAGRIEYATYRTVYEEVEEYWRQKFHAALSHPHLRNWTYYADRTKPEWPENIEITSALVIVDFSNWKEGTPDPTDEVDRIDLIKNRSGLKGPYAGQGLESYLVQFEKIKAQRNTGRPTT